MLQIILLILKILGIIILSILGILLVIMFLLLFLPLRYRLDAKKDEHLFVQAKVGWLFRIIYFKIIYLDDELIYYLKLFGITIKSNKQKPKKSKPKKSKPKKSKPKPKERKTKEPMFRKRREEPVYEVFPEDDFFRQSQPEEIESNEFDSIRQQAHKETDRDNFDSEKSFSERILHKIKALFHKLIELFKKIISSIIGLKNKIGTILTKLKELKNKLFLVFVFLQEEENQKGIKRIFKSLCKILKHMKPKKIEINLQFGTGDPASTGQLLGLMSVFYPRVAKSVHIIPDFENKVLEGNLKAKGRIRLVTLIVVGIKLYKNREFNLLWKNSKRLKEEL